MSSFLNFAKHNSVLLIIVILATILRFYQLGQNPPSLDWDETAHGYNAYSILKTGRDEYAYKLPLYFRSFDDYKPPIYTYLIVYELFKNKHIALLAALFLTISPWHLQFSRVAFETNSATFWSVLGTWGALKGIKSEGFKINM